MSIKKCFVTKYVRSSGIITVETGKQWPFGKNNEDVKVKSITNNTGRFGNYIVIVADHPSYFDLSLPVDKEVFLKRSDAKTKAIKILQSALKKNTTERTKILSHLKDFGVEVTD